MHGILWGNEMDILQYVSKSSIIMFVN